MMVYLGQEKWQKNWRTKICKISCTVHIKSGKNIETNLNILNTLQLQNVDSILY